MKRPFFVLLLLIGGIGSTCAQNTFPASGNVGVGTTNPYLQFHVVAPMSKTSTSVSIANAVSYLSTNDSPTPFGLRTMLFGAANIANRYVTLQTTDYSVADGGNIVLQPAAGNVGIGTTNPQALLDVGSALSSGSLGSVLARLSEGNTTGSGTYLGIRAYDTQPTGSNTDITKVKSFAIEHSFYGTTNSSINFYRGSSGSGGSISFNVNTNTEIMRLKYDGNVGIGTSSPDQKLTVNGTIHASAVKVDVNIPTPDYVFERSYNLRPLNEVSRYVSTYKHLPEVPSAAEMKKTGVDVNEMNMKLLQKVEELTLYLIEKDKKDARLQEQLNRLQRQIDHLKKRNNKS